MLPPPNKPLLRPQDIIIGRFRDPQDRVAWFLEHRQACHASMCPLAPSRRRDARWALIFDRRGGGVVPAVEARPVRAARLLLSPDQTLWVWVCRRFEEAVQLAESDRLLPTALYDAAVQVR